MAKVHYAAHPWPGMALPTVGRKLASWQLSAVSVVLSWSLPCSGQAGWVVPGEVPAKPNQTTGPALTWRPCGLCLLCPKTVSTGWSSVSRAPVVFQDLREALLSSFCRNTEDQRGYAPARSYQAQNPKPTLALDPSSNREAVFSSEGPIQRGPTHTFPHTSHRSAWVSEVGFSRKTGMEWNGDRLCPCKGRGRPQGNSRLIRD